MYNDVAESLSFLKCKRCFIQNDEGSTGFFYFISVTEHTQAHNWAQKSFVI